MRFRRYSAAFRQAKSGEWFGQDHLVPRLRRVAPSLRAGGGVDSQVSLQAGLNGGSALSSADHFDRKAWPCLAATCRVSIEWNLSGGGCPRFTVGWSFSGGQVNFQRTHSELLIAPRHTRLPA